MKRKAHRLLAITFLLVASSVILAQDASAQTPSLLPDSDLHSSQIYLATYIHDPPGTNIDAPSASVIVTFPGEITSGSRDVEIFDGALCRAKAGAVDTFAANPILGWFEQDNNTQCRSGHARNVVNYTFSRLNGSNPATTDTAGKDWHMLWRTVTVGAARFTYDPTTNSSSTLLRVTYANASGEWGGRNNGFKVHAPGGYVGFAGTGATSNANRVAMQNRVNPSGEDNFHIRFGAPCSVGSSTTLRWYDADRGAAGIPQDLNIRFELWNRTTNTRLATVPGDAPMGGNDAEGQFNFTPQANHKYEWIWYDVDGNNGVQFYLPNGYHGTNFYTECVGDPPEYDHVVKHGVPDGQPTEVGPGDVVTVRASVCNIGDGIYHASAANPLAIRIEAPSIVNGDGTLDNSRRFTRINSTYNSYEGNPSTPNDNIIVANSPNPDHAGHSRWEIRHPAGVPGAGSGTASNCNGTDSPGTGGYGSGRGWIEVSYDVPNNVIPGEEYCFRAIVAPHTGNTGPPSTGASSVTNSGTRRCFIVVNRPYFKVQGADLWAGAVFASQHGSDALGRCDASAMSGVTYGNLSDGDPTNDGHIYGNNLPNTQGSSGEYGIYGLGNTRIASANTRQMDLGLNPPYNLLNAIGLMFANSVPGEGFLLGGGNLIHRGYYYSDGQDKTQHSVISTPRCIDDYYKAAEAYFSPSETHVFNTNSFVLATPPGGHGHRLYKHTGSGPLVITRPAPGSYSNPRRITIITEQDVIIRNNILNNEIYESGGQLFFPQISIITRGGDIKVTETVDRVDARLIALPNEPGNGGNIYTCATTAAPYTPRFNLSTTICPISLVMEGQIFAKSLFLMRTGGTTNGLFRIGDSATPAQQLLWASEVISFDPGELLLAPLGAQGGQLDGDSEDADLPNISLIKELPPIY